MVRMSLTTQFGAKLSTNEVKLTQDGANIFLLLLAEK